jgi:predicted regulator of Ras-like GTPase activity (Roadblock/LC7/MglB family)
MSQLAHRLEAALADLLRALPEIEAAALVTVDGLPMASALPDGMNEDRVAAMSAALLSLGERAADGLGRGGLAQVSIEGEDGSVHLLAAGEEAVLVAVAAAGAKAGLVLFELRRTAAELGEELARSGERFNDSGAERIEGPAGADRPGRDPRAGRGFDCDRSDCRSGGHAGRRNPRGRAGARAVLPQLRAEPAGRGHRAGRSRAAVSGPEPARTDSA